MFGGRSASLGDWAADAVGIVTVYGSSLIESARKMARDHGDLPFSAITALGQRAARSRSNAVMGPIAAGESEQSVRFADRAARRFPRRDPV